MKETTLNFVKGFGSILDISPGPTKNNFSKQRQTVELRLQKSWDRVEQAFVKAVADFEGEINEERKK